MFQFDFFRRHGGVLLGLSGILFGSTYLYDTTNIRLPRLGDLLGPQFFPYILGIIFVACCVLLLVLEARKIPSKPKSYPPLSKTFVVTFLGAWALLIGYVWAVTAIGFIITAFLFIFLFLTLTQYGTLLVRTTWSAFLVTAFFMVFRVWLGIPLPTGLLAFFGE